MRHWSFSKTKTKTLDSGTALFTAGVPIASGIGRDNKSLEGKPLHKAHMEYRYGSSLFSGPGSSAAASFNCPPLASSRAERLFESSQGLRYQQLTMQAEQALELRRRSRLQLRASYDIHDVVKDPGLLADREYTAALREDELNLRSLLSWTPRVNQSVAVGLEFSREWFGKKPFSLTEDPAHNVRTDLEPWTTNTIGFFGRVSMEGQSPVDRLLRWENGQAHLHSLDVLSEGSPGFFGKPVKHRQTVIQPLSEKKR